MKVLVIGGGTSKEREISLKSSKAVYEASVEVGYTTEYYDWDGSLDWLQKNSILFDVVLPVLHGKGGEDGLIQSILEDLNVPFLGTDATHSSVCFDKEQTLEKLKKAGIRIPRGELVTFDEYKDSQLYNLPHVLKPTRGGSSLDTFIYPDVKSRNIDELITAFSTYSELLLEEFVEGTEITVPVLEGFELPVIEIIPPENETFDYKNKYNGKTQEIIPPLHLHNDTQKQAQMLAQKVHKILGCRHLSRIDMIVKGGTLYVLEANTMPGMTSQSLFPKSAGVAGLEMTNLIRVFINLTLAKEVL